MQVRATSNRVSDTLLSVESGLSRQLCILLQLKEGFHTQHRWAIGLTQLPSSSSLYRDPWSIRLRQRCVRTLAFASIVVRGC